MYRYDKLLAGASWVDEYGDPDNPEEEFHQWVFSISHYFDRSYPEIYFYTSTKDDRVILAMRENGCKNVRSRT